VATQAKKYNFTGKEVGHVTIDDRLVNAEANGQMIKDYIVAIRANARQWSASTKTRGEVAHTTKKPHPQKKTGRARQGSLVSPQYRGGGIVFGPKPKFDQHVRINKKERKAAIRFLISEKIKANQLHIVDSMELDAPKTKKIVDFLKARDLKKRVLFVGEGEYAEVQHEGTTEKISVGSDKYLHFNKSMRNIPKMAFSLALNVSGYDLILANDIVMTEAALNEITSWLS
jgi:large subunit ribosomal protein L4